MRQFEQLLFNAKPEKIEMLKDYCRENNVECYTIVENIPIEKISEFDKFLEENEICEKELKI